MTTALAQVAFVSDTFALFSLHAGAPSEIRQNLECVSQSLLLHDMVPGNTCQHDGFPGSPMRVCHRGRAVAAAAGDLDFLAMLMAQHGAPLLPPTLQQTQALQPAPQSLAAAAAAAAQTAPEVLSPMRSVPSLGSAAAEGDFGRLLGGAPPRQLSGAALHGNLPTPR